MFVAILINILIVLIVIFVPALMKAIELNKSGWDFVENVNESANDYLPIVAPDVNEKRSLYSKDIDKILNPTSVDDFSIDNFFDNLQ